MGGRCKGCYSREGGDGAKETTGHMESRGAEEPSAAAAQPYMPHLSCHQVILLGRELLCTMP